MKKQIKLLFTFFFCIFCTVNANSRDRDITVYFYYANAKLNSENVINYFDSNLQIEFISSSLHSYTYNFDHKHWLVVPYDDHIAFETSRHKIIKNINNVYSISKVRSFFKKPLCDCSVDYYMDNYSHSIEIKFTAESTIFASSETFEQFMSEKMRKIEIEEQQRKAAIEKYNEETKKLAEEIYGLKDKEALVNWYKRCSCDNLENTLWPETSVYIPFIKGDIICIPHKRYGDPFFSIFSIADMRRIEDGYLYLIRCVNVYQSPLCFMLISKEPLRYGNSYYNIGVPYCINSGDYDLFLEFLGEDEYQQEYTFVKCNVFKLLGTSDYFRSFGWIYELEHYGRIKQYIKEMIKE